MTILYCPVLPKSLTRTAAIHRLVQILVIYRVTTTDTVFSTFPSIQIKCSSKLDDGVDGTIIIINVLNIRNIVINHVDYIFCIIILNKYLSVNGEVSEAYYTERMVREKN